VHSGNLTTGQIDDAVTLFTQQALFHGVEKGYGLQMKNVDYDTPDHVMLAKLEKDTYYFSAAKNYWNVKELNYALIDDDGKVKSFSKFKEAAAAINEKYNVNYLKAEYNHAIASSTMARQWEDIKKASGSHPFLKYVTAGDANVRPEHAAMRGVIRRWDDAFWNTHYPPNGWLCRCDVEPMTDSAKATPADKLPGTAGIPTLFQTNTAKDGVIYPPKHPFHALPEVDAKDVLKSAQNVWKSNSAAYKQVAEYRNGGKVFTHALDISNDKEYNIKQASWWAEKAGHDIKIPPPSTSSGVPNPEIIRNLEGEERISDFKESTEKCSAQSIKNHLIDAKDKRCTELHFNLVVSNTWENVHDFFYRPILNKDHPNTVQTLFLRYNDNFIVVTKDEFEKGIAKGKFRWLLKHEKRP
jgi:SPP1 gp7 family putative phage head morphogenesis protein